MRYQVSNMIKSLVVALILIEAISSSPSKMVARAVNQEESTSQPNPSLSEQNGLEESKVIDNGLDQNRGRIVYGKIIYPVAASEPCSIIPCYYVNGTLINPYNDPDYQQYYNSFNLTGSYVASSLDDDNIVYATIDTGPQPREYNEPGREDQQKNNSKNFILVAPNPIQPDPNSDENAINIDKIKGLDFTLNKISLIKKSLQLQNNDKRLPRCINNKYDRLIEQEASSNNLSRPIIDGDGRYNNPFSTWRKQSLSDLIKFVMLQRSSSNAPRDKEEVDREIPLMKPNLKVDNSQSPGDFRVTWIGHATLLIQVDGYNILTDPIFSDRASPFQYIGPKRIREPAIDIKSLPKIDIVLISHNHYDHLDTNSVEELNERFGENCRWIVPLGVGDYMQSMNVKNYAELDWWQKDCFHIQRKQATTIDNQFRDNKPELTTISTNAINQSEQRARALQRNRIELDIYFTPTQHFTRRGIYDMNKSLWGSFVIISGTGSSFFFSGDTAYCPAFKEIGRIFGPFTGAAIPIGAYNPRWFLKTVHVNPEEAVQIHRDLRSNKSIAIHHSTFILSGEHYLEPATLLRLEADNYNIRNEFLLIKHGQTMRFCKSC